MTSNAGVTDSSEATVSGQRLWVERIVLLLVAAFGATPHGVELLVGGRQWLLESFLPDNGVVLFYLGLALVLSLLCQRWKSRRAIIFLCRSLLMLVIGALVLICVDLIGWFVVKYLADSVVLEDYLTAAGALALIALTATCAAAVALKLGYWIALLVVLLWLLAYPAIGYLTV